MDNDFESKMEIEINFEVEEHEHDDFDRLPDALLRLIFNRVRDASSLCRCMCVCKRFASIVPEIDSVSLKIPSSSSVSVGIGSDDHRPRKFLKSLINRVITKPLLFILRFVIRRKSSSRCEECDSEVSYYPPGEILNSFNEIQFLQIQLPGHGSEIGSIGGDSLLKWKAEFGSELESCVLFGATSREKIAPNSDNDGESDSDSLLHFSDDVLKLRVVWIISSLIAASSRHCLLKQIVADHSVLRSVEIADSRRQGRLIMREDQIEDLRRSLMKLPEKSDMSSSPSETHRLPALKMKLWYNPVLQLPASGCVMRGATLVMITPADRPETTGRVETGGELLARDRDWDGEEEREFGEAMRELTKKKCRCTLEMTSF